MSTAGTCDRAVNCAAPDSGNQQMGASGARSSGSTKVRQPPSAGQLLLFVDLPDAAACRVLSRSKWNRMMGLIGLFVVWVPAKELPRKLRVAQGEDVGVVIGRPWPF